MNSNEERCIRGPMKLPLLKIVTSRSNSAKLTNDELLNESVIEDSTPYFKHYRNQSSSIDNYKENDLSMICMKILKEQNELKQKIHQQAKMIQNIYKKRPPVPYKGNQFKSFMNQENLDVTFKEPDWPLSAKDKKRFKFPRDVFTRKSNSRQS